ncbi:hypothetical protein ACF0H5_001165 [Mactra antiquata]
MLRHKKSAHSDNEDDMSDSFEKEDIFGKLDDSVTTSSDEAMMSEEDDSSPSSDIDPWNEIIDEAYQKCQSQYDNKVAAVMDDDSEVSDEEAREDAFEDLKSVYRTAMMNSFGRKLLWFQSMKRDPIYNAIKKTFNRLVDIEGFDQEEALKYVILKRKFLFDKVLDAYDLPDLPEKKDNHPSDSA